ncbi:MAG TPA: hypothetical protein VFC65_10785 [Prolixibacteraceae bacterium]|nr:hypothetical protein [Prolixibacteraceae bacterium]
MKTSNYILISFFVFLFGGVFLLFISAKYIPHLYNDQEYSTLEKPLDPFSVLIAKPGSKIRLRPGETLKMSLFYPKSDSCTLPPFTVRNDTLFVSSYPDNMKQREVNVYCNSLKSIQEEKRSEVWIEQQFHSDSLLVKLDQSKFSYYSEKNSPIKASLIFIADQSNIFIGGAKFNKLEIQASSTKINGWNGSFGSLSGTLKNHSELSISRSNKINLEADSTSTYNIQK